MKKKTYMQFKKELLKDNGVKEDYEELGPEFANLEKKLGKQKEKE